MLDSRNLVDKYKNRSNEDIVADLDKSRISLEIAIENLAYDFNIGTIIRNANAFNVAKVHILGKRKYNRRGAMVTDKYLHISHWESSLSFVEDAKSRGKNIVAIENNRPASKPIHTANFLANTVFIFGSESDGISPELLRLADQAFYIEQLGSTRSINVASASAIAIYEFVRQQNLFPR